MILVVNPLTPNTQHLRIPELCYDKRHTAMKYQLVAVVVLALLAFAFAPAQDDPQHVRVRKLSSPFQLASNAQWRLAVIYDEEVSALPDSSSYKSTLKFLFGSLKIEWDNMQNGANHPLMLKVYNYDMRVTSFLQEIDFYNHDVDRYQADGKDYLAAGGGGKYSESDPKYITLKAWYDRRQVELNRLNALETKFKPTEADLNAESDALIRQLEEELRKFRSDCADYLKSAGAAVSATMIDKKIESTQGLLKADRLVLDRFGPMAPGLLVDIELMAEEHVHATPEDRLLALDKAVGIGIDTALLKAGSHKAPASSQLRKILINGGVSPQDAKQALGSASTMKQVLKQLGQLRSTASTYGALTKERYLRAIAACLSASISNPALNLLAEDFDSFSNLLHPNLYHPDAMKRMAQFWKISEADLRSMAKISVIYQQHLTDLATLRTQRDHVGG